MVVDGTWLGPNQKKLKNFSGNMYAYMVRGALIAIRNDDANEILVEVI